MEVSPRRRHAADALLRARKVMLGTTYDNSPSAFYGSTGTG
jgi:hypothetical protein